MRFVLIKVIKTNHGRNYKLQKEMAAYFDKTYAIDLSEEKKVAENMKMMNLEVKEVDYKEKTKTINEIARKEEDGTWIMVLEEDEIIEGQTLKNLRDILPMVEEQNVYLYEIEERKKIKMHTAIAKPKLFKKEKIGEYCENGIYKVAKNITRRIIKEEYIKQENKEKNKYELKKMSSESDAKTRFSILRRNNNEREAMFNYEKQLKKFITEEDKKEYINELMMIYLKNRQYKKMEELLERYIEEEKDNKEFQYLLMKYCQQVELYDLAETILDNMETKEDNEMFYFLENNKINNLNEKYNIAMATLDEAKIVQATIENIRNNNDTLAMHVNLNKLILNVYGEKDFKQNLTEMYQTKNEKAIMYNVLNEMGMYKEYGKEIKEKLSILENQDIATMYIEQFNEEGRKRAIDFSKIHNRKIYAVIFNHKNKLEAINKNIKKEKTLTMLSEYIQNPLLQFKKGKYKKHYYIKLLREAKRIKDEKIEEKLLSISHYFEYIVNKEIAQIYIDEYDYEKAVVYLEKYTLTNINDMEANQKLCKMYKKIGKTEDYIRMQMRIIRQEPYNKYRIDELLNDINKDMTTEKEKTRIMNEIQKINLQLEGMEQEHESNNKRECL